MSFAQLASICFGVISACLWFCASFRGFREVKDLPAKSGPGDLGFNLEGGGAVVLEFSKQNRINAFAALFSGLAILAQVFVSSGH